MKKRNKIIIVIVVAILLIISIIFVFAKMLSKDKQIYEVVFEDGYGLIIETQKVEEGQKVLMPKDPEKEGYLFIEWTEKNKTYDFSVGVTSNLTLKAKWKLIEKEKEEIIVKFNSDGGTTIPNIVIEKGNKITEPTSPKKEGYKFIEWQLENVKFDFNTDIVENIELVAKYEKIIEQPNLNNNNKNKPSNNSSEQKQEETKKYTVIFNTLYSDATKIPDQVVEENKTVKKPEIPVKEGYKFIEWQFNGKKYDFNTKVTANLILNALWERNEYIVSFDANNGISDISSKVVKYGLNYGELPIPIRDGYHFLGWSTDINILKYIGENTRVYITNNHTLYAHWEKIVTELYWNNSYNGVELPNGDIPSNTYEKVNDIPNIDNLSVYIKTDFERKHYVCLYYNSKQFCAKSINNYDNKELTMNEFKKNIENSLGITNLTCEYNSDTGYCTFNSIDFVLYFEENDIGIMFLKQYDNYDYICGISNGRAGCFKEITIF